MTDLSNQETIFLHGEDYFTALLVDIANATERIEIETYIFHNDPLGLKIATALAQAAQKGVQVRVLVDGVGTPSWDSSFIRILKSAAVETRVFHPIPWRFWQWRRSIVKLPLLFKIAYLLSRVNKRNHRKVCIIDRKFVYVGSANISECHLCAQQGGKDWRDTVVRLSNTDISNLEMAFEEAWEPTSIQERLHNLIEPINRQAIFRLNNSRHRRRVLYKNLLYRLSKCKTRVWITNAYFVPDNFLLKKLHDLAQLGIDVRILLPQKADIFMMTWASSTFYERLLKSGVRIFEYIPSMLHAKSLILDDWYIVGSSNLNHRSLLHDLEVDVNIRSTTAKKLLENQFLADLAQSKEIDLQSWNKRLWFQKIIGRLLLYVRFWI
jgi:cardiolipin synthase A/B